ncbi:hypothetical protein MAE_07210 [Microcystis aeruginosa NIES-843]|uniref:Uncharacterized protein n=1 Tax=Microcystis aeruginosa (strain NIES-843 / IAM M-2473) TaxID=449447 RepID=B0JQ84_MICAN|nr:hypothetical protein MAE_07210 [Microcystis aeruginosa NIES-843]
MKTIGKNRSNVFLYKGFIPYNSRPLHNTNRRTEEICSIASGAVESTVKQIDRRLKISGAQWNEENIPQVLKHRCAYLNNSL